MIPAADLHLDRLERAGGTDAGGYFRLARGVLLALPRPGFVQTEASAERSLLEFDRIAQQAGEKQALVVFVDRVASQSGAARRVWSRARDGETRCGQALVCGTMLARAIGSFFLGFNRAPFPTRMFPTLEEALTWAEKTVAEHGGPLEP